MRLATSLIGLIRLVPLVVPFAATTGCTTLGPTPATTGLSARPLPRSGAELQAGIMPGHYLSSAVVESPDSAGIPQVSAVFQADELTGLPGIVVGVRAFGEEGDTPIEPVLGYRTELGPDGRVALGGYVYGTRAKAEDDGASYEATRVGGELTGDVRVLAVNRWAEPHLFAGFNATHLDVDGTYCTGADQRWGEDCAQPPDPAKPVAIAAVNGTFAAVNAGASVEIMRHRASWFQGARVAFTAAGGMMPRVEAGRETSPTGYFAFGLSLSVGVGAGAGDAP